MGCADRKLGNAWCLVELKRRVGARSGTTKQGKRGAGRVLDVCRKRVTPREGHRPHVAREGPTGKWRWRQAASGGRRHRDANPALTSGGACCQENVIAAPVHAPCLSFQIHASKSTFQTGYSDGCWPGGCGCPTPQARDFRPAEVYALSATFQECSVSWYRRAAPASHLQPPAVGLHAAGRRRKNNMCCTGRPCGCTPNRLSASLQRPKTRYLALQTMCLLGLQPCCSRGRGRLEGGCLWQLPGLGLCKH